jgi:hypothetical protein
MMGLKLNFVLNIKNFRWRFRGLSRVRALPLAASRKEGGHYFHYKILAHTRRELHIPAAIFYCYSNTQKGLA